MDRAWVFLSCVVPRSTGISRSSPTSVSQRDSTGGLTEARFLLMIPGHTKFSPGPVFAQLAHTFYKVDVFTTAARYGKAKELHAADLKTWKDELSTVYRSVPGIKGEVKA
eukprot:scpid64632/ scgid9562/ 